MELSWLLVFKIVLSLAGVIACIGMFAEELSWSVKLKIAVALLLGIILIGFLAPLGTPAEPHRVISIPTLGKAIILLCLAVLTGFIGYFLSRPYGREIGILAVPSGLALWAVKSGSMSDLARLNVAITQRQAMFAALKWEPFFWLAVVAAGFCGVLLGRLFVSREPSDTTRSSTLRSAIVPCVIAIAGSVLIAQFGIGIFTQDIRVIDRNLGSVIVQPATGQIVFSVLVSFAIAGFVVKKFLDAGYIWPIVSSAFVTGFAVITTLSPQTLRLLVEHHPPAFSSSAVLSVLPVQMVSFGALGAIAGHWLAVRTDFRRKRPQT
jgi:hypothetical protein